MSNEERRLMCRDLALLEVFKKLNDKYAGVSLSKGQIYAFYQENFFPEDFEEIVNAAMREELP